MRDDRYTWRENTHEVIGERTGRRFRAGDRLQVILDRVLAQERRLQFSIVEEGLILTRKKKAGNGLSKPRKSKRADGAAQASKGKKRFGGRGKHRR
jgi:ribonuclease R